MMMMIAMTEAIQYKKSWPNLAIGLTFFRVQIKIKPRFFLEDKKLLEKKNDVAIFAS
jgi:hypothetical protein